MESSLHFSTSSPVSLLFQPSRWYDIFMFFPLLMTCQKCILSFPDAGNHLSLWVTCEKSSHWLTWFQLVKIAINGWDYHLGRQRGCLILSMIDWRNIYIFTLKLMNFQTMNFWILCVYKYRERIHQVMTQESTSESFCFRKAESGVHDITLNNANNMAWKTINFRKL